MIPDNNICITLHWEKEKRNIQYEFISKNNFGVEIISFSHYSVWENDYSNIINQYKNELKDLSIKKISFHGPISDILPHSDVSQIQALAYNRILKSIEIALELSAKKIVFHTGINTIITDPVYIQETINKQAIFWQSVCDKYRNIEILIENMWEKDTEYILKICQLTNRNNFGICLDVGHINVYSSLDLSNWVKNTSKYIKHIHLNDNNGIWDEHLALGKGNINWIDNILTLEKLPNIDYVIELTDLNSIKESLQFIGKI